MQVLGLALTVFGASADFNGAAMAQNRPTKLVGANQIFQDINKSGLARVIVFVANELEVQDFTRQLSSHMGRASALANIKQRSVPVIRDYYPNGLNSRGIDVRAFDLMPAFATEVTETELLRMQKDTRIFKIVRDDVKKINLNSSVQLIGLGAQQLSVNPEAAPNGAGRTVAVIDTGVQRDHPFITSPRVVAEACFLRSSTCPGGKTSAFGSGASVPAANESHGTHVSGIAMGRYSALSPVNRGVASSASLVMVNVFGAQGGAYDSDIISGLEFVYRLKTGTDPIYPRNDTIDSVNMSLGGDLSYPGACDGDSAAPAINALRGAGVLTVIAAGNSSWTSGMSSPGCISTAISVAATAKTDKVISSYSNISATTTLFAPGGDFSTGCVMSSVMNSTYDAYCGTSMATPHVTGAIALLRAAKPLSSADEIVAALTMNMPSVKDMRSGGTITKPFLDITAAIANINNQKLRAVSITVSGTGKGYVTSSLGSLSCQSNVCSGTFVVGSTVTFNAVPDAQSTVKSWSIPGVSCNLDTCSFAVPDNTVSGSVQIDTALVGVNTAVDNTTLTFSLADTGKWYGLANAAKSYDKVDVARNPVLLDSQRSSFQTSVTGPGTVSFAWSVSSELSYDYLRFYINGVEQVGSISGNVGYQTKSWTIPCGGPHILKWTYSKDVSIAAGDDAGYVDQISYSQGSPCAAPTLRVVVSPSTSWGTVTSSPSGINCGASGTQCSKTFTSGATVKLTAKAARGRTFVGWSNACTGVSSTCTLSMTQARDVTATFR